MNRIDMKRIAIILGGLLITTSNIWAQCAMCAASVESNDENMVGKGLNSGIYFLMAAPYLLIGTVAFIWYRTYKNKQRDQNSSLD